MNKTFWSRTGRPLVQGLLLFCLRLAQNRTGFDPETGLAVPNTPRLVLIACVVLCAVAEIALCLRLPKEKARFADCFAVPERETPFLAAGSVLISGGGAVLLVSALPRRGIAAMAAGVTAVAAGLGLLLLVKRLRAGGAVSVLPVLPVMFFSVFFVLAVYLPAESDPVLARFWVPVLAAALTAYAFSLLGGFLRGESSRRTFVPVADMAVLLCITALADAGGLGRMLLFAGCATVLVTFLALLQPDTAS